MRKPYSQDLRDRVIDTVERGEMSRRAAARRYEISESVAIKRLASGLNALNGMARETLSGTVATGRPS
jgi:transposase